MNILKRDLNIWLDRMRECHNPLLWLSALNYDRQRLVLLQLVSSQPTGVFLHFLREIEDDFEFTKGVRTRMMQWANYKPRAIDFMMSGRSGSVFFNEVTVYAIVRLIQPQVMIETGGTPGKSTAFILRAMEKNKTGHLYTIDLPPQVTTEQVLSRREGWHQALPTGATSGWVVPDNLRHRNTLLSGKSSEQLPPLLEKLGQVDIFLHDSDHSYENMTWEFETVWPRLNPQGLLLSDDVLDNRSFFDFVNKKNLRHRHVFNLGAARVGNNSHAKL